jgi:hypothetical protein
VRGVTVHLDTSSGTFELSVMMKGDLFLAVKCSESEKEKEKRPENDI